MLKSEKFSFKLFHEKITAIITLEEKYLLAKKKARNKIKLMKRNVKPKFSFFKLKKNIVGDIHEEDQHKILYLLNSAKNDLSGFKSLLYKERQPTNEKISGLEQI